MISSKSLKELAAKYKTDPSSLTASELLSLQRVTKALNKGKNPLDGKWIASLADVAVLLGGKSTRSVTRWETEGKIPSDAKLVQGYDLGKLTSWLWGKMREGGISEERKESLLFRAAKREKAQIEVGQLKLSLILRDDAERAFGRLCIESKNLLMNLPHLLGAQVPPEMRAHIEDVTERHVRSVLRALETGEVVSEEVPGASAADKVAVEVQNPSTPAGPGVV